MAKYQKKIEPVVVDAYQIGTGLSPTWFLKAVESGRIILHPDKYFCVSITNDMTDPVIRARLGDFVFLRSDEYIAVSSEDIFKDVYEPVKESHPSSLGFWTSPEAKMAMELQKAAKKVGEEIRSEIRPLVEIKKAEVTDGLALGSSIVITAEFKGSICEAHLDDYIAKLTDISKKVKDYHRKENISTVD